MTKTEKEEEEFGSDEELIDFLNTTPTTAPSNFFEHLPSTDTTGVRTQNFVLKNLVSQLKNPLNLEAEAVCKWLIYKQSGPQRHQKFFGFFRQMSKNVRKFNDMSLIKKLNTVLKKAENCGNSMYKIEESAVIYMGAAYLRRIFLLEKIQKSAEKCAEGVVGLLELEQWINLSLVIFAVSAQIHTECHQQILEMERVWKSGASIFRAVDHRFPMEMTEIGAVRRMKKSINVEKPIKNSENLAAITRLLKFSEERIETAQAENELRLKTSEILHEVLTTEMTSTSESSSKSKPGPSSSAAQFDMSDLGISISREDASFLNSTIQSTSTTFLLKSDEDGDDDEDSLLMSPNLFAPKSLKKVKKSKKSTVIKRKSEAAPEDVTTTPKKIQKTSSFLTSTLDLLSGSSSGKKKKKKSKNN